MPIVVPPYVQYQAPLYPLRGLWNNAPPEGDRMVSAEIDWGVTTGPGMAVQFQLSGNSPVAFSQIVAMQVDNTSNASDVQFLFPDSGYTLVVPAYTQITTPVFTNALQFYVFSPGAVAGDRTLFQAFNSVPPPVAVQASSQQEHASVTALSLSANGNTAMVPAVSGTLESLSIFLNTQGAVAPESCSLSLLDGLNNILWIGGTVADIAETVTVGPIRVQFINGIYANVAGTSLTLGYAIINVYFGVP